MKKPIGLLTALLFVCVAFSGCKKDKDETEPNYFQIGETKYDISACVTYNHPEPGKVVDGIEMYFTGPDIDLSDDIDGNPKWTGTDLAVYLFATSTSSSELDPGTYTYTDTYEPFTFSYGDYSLEYTYAGSNTYVTINGGSFTVTVNGTAFEISFEGTDENSNTLKLHYSGEINYHTPQVTKEKK